MPHHLLVSVRLHRYSWSSSLQLSLVKMHGARSSGKAAGCSTSASASLPLSNRTEKPLPKKNYHKMPRAPSSGKAACCSTSASYPPPLSSRKEKPLPEKNYYETLDNEWGVFFWRPPGFLSNWTSSPFQYDGVMYCHPEQAIMHQKALLFGDDRMAERIMSTRDPKQHKAYGRKVHGFRQELWDQTLPNLLFGILLAKFSQNQAFALALLQTGRKQIFESSPVDLVWGTGVSPQDSVECSEQDAWQWKGGNLLGKTLMKVRDALANNWEQSTHSSSSIQPGPETWQKTKHQICWGCQERQ